MKCIDCVLWYIEDGDDYPHCHADPNWPAPCEYEDIDDDFGFDSYEGCYTYDY